METKEKYATVRSGLFIRGIGGFGNKGKLKLKYPKPPQREADFVSEEKTDPNLCFLYRLNSDVNPLHVDPDMAAMGGFDKPILHGLCTYGITARVLQQHFFKDDPNALKAFGTRFTSHVFPGETLVVEAWKEGNMIITQAKTKERGKIVLKGYVTL